MIPASYDWNLSCDCGPSPRKMARNQCLGCLKKRIRSLEASYAALVEELTAVRIELFRLKNGFEGG